MVWFSSSSASSVTVIVRFCVLLPVGVNVTDLVWMRKSPGLCALAYSVAVPPVSTVTLTVMSDCGLWEMAMGTVNVPPVTFSATVRSRFVVWPEAPNPILALLSSSSVMVTVAVFWPLTTSQPAVLVVTVTVNVSSPSTSASLVVGMLSVPVFCPDAIVSVAGVVPVSAVVAVLPA